MQPKVPDLKLTDDEAGEEIFVEVSRLRPGAKQNQLSRTQDVIRSVVHTAMHLDPGLWEELLNPKHVLPYVRIRRALDEGELRVVAGKVEEVIREDHRTGPAPRRLPAGPYLAFLFAAFFAPARPRG